MSNAIPNLLIPVDFSLNTEVAIKKATEFAVKGSQLHLMHVSDVTTSRLRSRLREHFSYKSDDDEHAIIGNELNLLKEKIEKENESLTVCTWIVTDDNIQNAIERKAKQLAVDLILIAKKSYHSWFPFLNTVIPSKIVQKTGIAVLTVRPASANNKIKTVVVPISGEATKEKMDFISMISMKCKVKVHLVTFMKDDNKPVDYYASSLLQVYQWLQTSLHCQVEYALLQGGNKARSILSYAEKISADVLLVNPASETKIGWLNQHISDMLPPTSKVQVLTIQPASIF